MKYDKEMLLIKTVEILKVNPFSDEYYYNELNNFKINDYNGDSVKIVHKTLPFRVHLNFMYEDLYEQKESFPVMYINDNLFMSLTRMEIQSHFMPIYLAKGKVGVGGLGLGYYLQSIVKKDDVKEIIVYEQNQEVIDLYINNFGENNKVKFENKNVFDVKGESFDFFYMDIYSEACDETAIDDMNKFCKNNSVKRYHFWTMEGFIQAVIDKLGNLAIKVIPKDIANTYVPFLVLLEGASVRKVNHIDALDTIERFGWR